MADHFIKLNCANCGAKLDVYDDMDRFACGFCGTELIAQRRGGTIALKAVTEAIKRVQVGTDKTAAELALARLNEELKKLTANAAELSYTRRTNRALSVMVGVPGVFFGLFLIMFSIIGRSSSAFMLGLALAAGSGIWIKMSWAQSEPLAAITKRMAEVERQMTEQRRIVDVLH
jgi:ribosomal protein S27E